MVTFLFTDIQGSTALLRRLGGDNYSALLHEHHTILTRDFEQHRGQVFDTAGDALFVAFVRPQDAVKGAVAGQLSLIERNARSDVQLAVRMGVHTGPAAIGPTGYVGLGLHHTARISGQAHGSQILVSDATAALIADTPVDDVTLEDLGAYRLKDIPGSHHIFCVRHPRLPADFEPLEAAPPGGNLPVPVTTFVGRDRELDELVAMLGTERMLTVVATSGIGKTRLAVEVAAAATPRFRDGAWMVDLSEARSAEDAFGAIASVFSLLDTGDRDAVADAISRHLSSRNTLLLLDNCERVADEVAHFASEVVRACPGIALLLTSQRPLHADGETVYRLSPLELPSGGADISNSESVRLFADRARAARAGFALDASNSAAVLQICRQLDGIPFAIELAAALVAAFTPRQLADRLEEVFAAPLPSSGPQRHSTLSAAVSWSYGLLDEAERLVLARLSVFSGNCTLDAAEAVCSGGLPHGMTVLGGIASLVDKSLVVFDHQGDPPVYRLLQMVRSYAAQRLAESGEQQAFAERHLDFYLNLAEGAAPHLTGSGQTGIEDELETALDNLRAAFLHALTREDATGALRMASATWRFLEDRGHWRDWQLWFEQSLTHPGGAPEHVRAYALVHGSVVAERLGDLVLCDERAAAALEIFRDLGDEAGSSFAISFLGNSAMDRGDSQRAITCFQTALEIRRRIGDRRGVGVSLANLGKALYERGDYAAARPLMEEALAAFEETSDTARVAAQLGDVALVSLAVGSIDAAFVHAAKGLELARMSGHHYITAWNTALLGRALVNQGELRGGLALLAEAIQVLADLGDDRSLLSVAADVASALCEDAPLDAAALLAAVRGLRQLREIPPDFEEAGRYDSMDAVLESSALPGPLESARERGSRMDLETTGRFALSLAIEASGRFEPTAR
jgi:predicted ATPase/class 3 adenylate cyclase